MVLTKYAFELANCAPPKVQLNFGLDFVVSFWNCNAINDWLIRCVRHMETPSRVSKWGYKSLAVKSILFLEKLNCVTNSKVISSGKNDGLETIIE